MSKFTAVKLKLLLYCNLKTNRWLLVDMCKAASCVLEHLWGGTEEQLEKHLKKKKKNLMGHLADG